MSVNTVDEFLARARRALQMPTLYWLSRGGWTNEQAATPQPGTKFDARAELAALKRKDPVKFDAYTAGARRAGIDLDHAEGLPQLACDCSGFVAWCLGVPRYPAQIAGQAKGWIYTDAMHADAQRQRQLFTRLETPRAGALLVYPSAGPGQVGHVAIVTEVAGGQAVRIIHCAPENVELPPQPGQPLNAIRETDTGHFKPRPDTICVAWNAFLPG